MGTWGTGPFDSDMAEDFLDRLEGLSAAQRAELIDSRLGRALSNSSEELPGEVLAAAAVVAASLPSGRDLPWNEDYPGIDSWLGMEDIRNLAPLAARALEVSFPPDGWFWRSWVDEEERSEARTVFETLRTVLVTIDR